MSGLKELRNRISSVQATQKITRAMQMVAASKLRRAKENAQNARPYAEQLASLISRIAGSSDMSLPLLKGGEKNQVHLLIVATSERGLCGGFNASIARLAIAHAKQLKAEGKQVKVLPIGRKGYEVLKRQFDEELLEVISFRQVKHIGFGEAEGVGEKILTLFEEGGFDCATLFFARFRSVISQVPTAVSLIPAHIEEGEAQEPQKGAPPAACYEYEPEEEEVVSMLLARNISAQILQALLENAASEQGARMSAMDNATRNAGDMIDRLSITYNRTRQAIITKELIEIISGAEAI